MTGEPAAPGDEWTERRQATYNALLVRGSQPDRLADLWLRHGSGVFDRDVPYLLVALRRLAIDEYRRVSREARVAEQYGEAVTRTPFTEADPAEIAAARSELRGIASALASLEERDAWALWWHAAGLADDEIAERWTEAGFRPANPSTDLLRKRRQRARAALRALLAGRGGAPGADPPQ